MKLRNLFQLALLATVIMFTSPSCVKEGPMGPAGADGTNGTNGVDGINGINGTNAGGTCAVCHTKAKVDLISTQFQLSKHNHGTAAFEEAGIPGCTPCHAQEAFKYVVKNNIPSTFSADPKKAGFFKNDYTTIPSAAYGNIGCGTCHSEIHTTYAEGDMALTTVAAVPMTMWGGLKTIDIKADGGVSNLCVKCHQPRPFVNALTGNVQDYVAIAATPAGVMYDGTAELPNTNDKVRPAYRMHTHYGTAGAVFAGMGGVEFAGIPYTNSAHTTAASCVDCHMGDMNGKAGGHTFTAKGNLKTCNATGCHSTEVNDKTPRLWVDPRAEIKTLLNNLAAKLTIGGVDILNRNPDAEHNLWVGLTTNKYDGYLNIYDPINNPNGVASNGNKTFKFIPGSVNPSTDALGFPKTWAPEYKVINTALPEMPNLTNAQFGAIINFQLCLRDYSLGIHNYAYTKALLTNSIAVLQ